MNITHSPQPKPTTGTEKRKKKLPKGVYIRSGDYWIRWTCDGQKHRKKIGKSLKQAVAMVEKMRTLVREGRFREEFGARPKQKPRLADAIERQLTLARTEKRSWKDDRRYARYWNEYFKKCSLESIRSSDIERYKAERLREVKPATVNRAIAYLKRVFNLAIQDQLITFNPVSGVKMFRENNRVERYLSDEEEVSLRAVMKPELFEVVEIAMLTGLRRSEQFGMRWEDVDFATKMLTVPRSKHGEKRFVPLHERVLKILYARRVQVHSDWVFPSPVRDWHIDPTHWIRTYFTTSLVEAGIEDFTWHCLRHTFGSRLMMAGRQEGEVMKVMGHKTLAMTMRYTHFSKGRLHEVVNSI